MKIIEYFTKDGPPKLKYRKKTVEVPKVKCELFFVGRNGELENYVESYTGRYDFTTEKRYSVNRAETPEEIMESLFKSGKSKVYGNDFIKTEYGQVFLANNNRTMNMEYYTLAKVVIKDVKQVEIEIEEPYYEEE